MTSFRAVNISTITSQKSGFIQCYYMIPYAVTSFAPKLPSIPLPQVPWPPVPRRPWNFETSIDPNLCDLPDPRSYVTSNAVVVSMTSKCSILSNHMIYSMCHKCKNVCQTSMQILKYYSATTCTVPFANHLPILNQIFIPYRDYFQIFNSSFVWTMYFVLKRSESSQSCRIFRYLDI